MDKQIHITALAPYKIYPAKMGGQKGIALFYQYVSELLPVTVVSTKNNEEPQKSSIDFMPVLGNSRLRYINPFLFFKFRKIIKEKKSSHFILEHPYYGWLGILLKSFTGIQLVIHSHNIESLRFKSNGKWWWKILWRYEKFVHRKADINFFISEEDRQFAISNYNIPEGKCHTITYGIEMDHFPSSLEKKEARNKINALHSIDERAKILLFNGTLSYKPNLDAVDAIIKHINPLLKQENKFPYRIIISGKGLPPAYNNLSQWREENIIYTGFVDDITIYFKAADIFMNPVTDGGGIKTKLVEALGNNVNAVSFFSGAIGVPAEVAGKKLAVIPDGDHTGFANAVFHTNLNETTPQKFFEHFYWGNIAKKVAAVVRMQN